MCMCPDGTDAMHHPQSCLRIKANGSSACSHCTALIPASLTPHTKQRYTICRCLLCALWPTSALSQSHLCCSWMRDRSLLQQAYDRFFSGTQPGSHDTSWATFMKDRLLQSLPSSQVCKCNYRFSALDLVHIIVLATLLLWMCKLSTNSQSVSVNFSTETSVWYTMCSQFSIVLMRTDLPNMETIMFCRWVGRVRRDSLFHDCRWPVCAWVHWIHNRHGCSW